MFDKIKDVLGNAQMMQKMMQDESFRAFISHPKVQELFRDAEFKEVAKTRDFSKIAGHPKFMALSQDSELSTLMLKINPTNFMKL